jgi:hypothetical protein
MVGRLCCVVVLLFIATAIAAQQIILSKKDHVYAGINGSEIAVITPPPTDTTAPTAPTLNSPTIDFT